MRKQVGPYSEDQLFAQAPQAPLTGRRLDEVAFPLGGIGAGMITLGGWGQLRDWEIRNRPAKGYRVPEAFFMLKVRKGKRAVVRVLEGPIGGSYVGDGHSLRRDAGQGLPRFRNVSFDGRYPIATVRLDDADVPLDVELVAFNPFIPLNDKDSSIPTAILLYRLTNRTDRTVRATIFGNLTNIIGDPSSVRRVNRARNSHGISGLYLTSDAPADRPDTGSMALATPWPDTGVWPRWKDERIAGFWQATAESEEFPPAGSGRADTGTLAAHCTIKAGETVTVPFLIAWYFPVFEHWRKPEGKPAVTWRNYYASLWSDAWDVAAYVAENLERLHSETALFRDALFASTLPAHVLDAVSSQISTLKTPTCLRLQDGTFYGFEGCSDTQGCCEGTCTHVWNYAQALPYLFPALQRTVHRAQWDNSLHRDGFMTFRMPLPLGTKGSRDFHPAADGQMGTVLQVYREWLISGDRQWLREMWPKAKKALEFAWKYWDADRDGVMEGMQHNTYDVEFYGPNTITGTLYLAALRAAELMADELGERQRAALYRSLRERGSAWTDRHLFNGEYYEQKVRPNAHKAWPRHLRELAQKHGRDGRFPWPKWQYGKGCMSDQLIGQWYARMLGLGNLLDGRNIRKTLRSIFKYNWRPNLWAHPCLYRIYALGGEAGLLVGTWPKGARPGHAMYYADEVFCGIEYQVASHLVYEGMVEEGLAIVKGVRDRYTGERRNPWDEFECGHHYARSLASYALLLALSGFSCRASEGRIGFAPRIFEDDFKCFFSVDSGWGLYGQKLRDGSAEATVKILYGALTLGILETGVTTPKGARIEADLDGQRVGVAPVNTGGRLILRFDEPLTLKAGQTLHVVSDKCL